MHKGVWLTLPKSDSFQGAVSVESPYCVVPVESSNVLTPARRSQVARVFPMRTARRAGGAGLGDAVFEVQQRV